MIKVNRIDIFFIRMIILLYAEEQNQIKFFAKLKAIREHNNRMFDSNDNVLIIWKYPKYEFNHPYNHCIWDLETCYNWLVENTIHDHNALKVLICQIHNFFSDYASSNQLKIDYSPQQSADFTEALILSFEHTNNYDVHHLNRTLFFNEGTLYQNKEEFIRALENSKNDILNNGWLEFKLRAFRALLEDSNLPMPTSIVTKILKKIKWLYVIIEKFLLIQRFLYLEDW
ncbi:MAG: hypothetical protein LCH30_11830 [Proteobacteria bacterium]|nr:hypothetical protein [Pseudomonadota bacterium]